MTQSDPALTDALPARTYRWALLAILAIGCVARVHGAQGGLWIDEAWSVIFAQEAAPFLGVFASIHHDNNHHLNTLWLQLVGTGAPSILMRGLSIATGTATIWVAAQIGMRRGQWTALITALLFALSPMLVLYGSEARGYAPMLLCLMGVILLCLRWSDTPEEDFPAPAVSRLALVGTVSHLMMAPGLALIAGWTGLTLWRRDGFVSAARKVIPMWLPAAIMSALILGLVLGGAKAIAGGMGVGSFTPFSVYYFDLAMGELATLTSGAGPFGATSPLGALILVLLCAVRPRGIPLLFVILILALPLAVLLFQPGNSQFSRYYLISAAGLLLLGGDRLGAMMSGHRPWSIVGGIIVCAFAFASANQIRDLVAVGRGHPERPVALLKTHFPNGALVLINHERAQAVLRVSAAQAGYPLTLSMGNCSQKADAFFVERERGVPIAPRMIRCDRAWRPIGAANAIGPSGQSWTLYTPEEPR